MKLTVWLPDGMFSALFAFRHSTLCEPKRLMNSMESKPRPSDDTKMAEFILARWQRSDITVDGSSVDQCGWMCWSWSNSSTVIFETKDLRES